MSNIETWDRGDTKTRVWLMVKAAGEQGIGRKELLAAVGVSSTALDFHLTNMLRDHCVRRPDDKFGMPVWGRYVAGQQVPPIDGYALELALELLDDCPQGVSAQVLCAELRLAPGQVEQLLEPSELAGKVERITMPQRHGGGLGWCCVPGLPGLPEVADVSAETEFKTPLQVVETVALPVVAELDIDRIHHVYGDRFEAELRDGALTIRSGATTLTLRPEHAQRLMDLLTPHVLARVCHD